MDRMLRANTVKYRTHSLFRQGWMLFELLPNMRASKKTPLLRRFGEMMREQVRAPRDRDHRFHFIVISDSTIVITDSTIMITGC